MSDWAKRCKDSAKQVADGVRKDDTILILWATYHEVPKKFFQLLSDPTDSSESTNSMPVWESKRAKHPQSGEEIMFICTPHIAGYPPLSAIKEGLKIILSDAAQKGANFCAHLWLQDMSSALESNGKPRQWDSLKTIFEGLVELDELSLITVCWEDVAAKGGYKDEDNMKKALEEDLEAGLVFIQLWKWDKEEAWNSINNTDVQARMRRVRVRKMKQELVDIRTELEKADDGQLVLAEIRQTIAAHQVTLRPLIHQLRHEELADEERKKMEKKAYEEFLTYRREMRGMLLEVKAWKIKVGPFLWDWFFNEPPPLTAEAKKRFFFF